MTTVHYTKLDETNAMFDSDNEGVIYEIVEYFSFMSPQAKYDYRFKNHLWDGKIRLASAKTRKIPLGLKTELKKFCDDRGYEFIDQTPEKKQTPIDSLEGFDEFIKSLKLPFEPRDYQINAVKWAIQNNRGIIVSPTGCHGYGQKVIMADGSLKEVQDIEVGNRLLGYNGKERIVQKLCEGTSMLYKVKPKHRNSFTVNTEHVLPLMNINTKEIDYIEVDKYLSETKEYKENHFLMTTPKNSFGELCYDTFTIEPLGLGMYYGFQLDGDHLYYTDNGVLNHNSGKSLIQYIICRWHMNHGRRFCLIVPSINLVEQMASDFRDYAKNDDSFNVDDVVQLVYNKKAREIDETKSTISTWQSMVLFDDYIINGYDLMLIDETHRARSAQITKLLKSAKNVPYKIGLTGSLDGEVINTLTIMSVLGDIYHVTTTKELQAEGTLSDLLIYCITIKHQKTDCKSLRAEDMRGYADEVKFITNNEKRNRLIRNLACSLEGTTMVIFKHKDHGKALYELIKEKVGDSRDVYYIDGDVSEREDIRQALNKKSGGILVSSVGTTATGLNIPSIRHIILTNPSKSRVQTIQAIGRSLRTAKDKEMAYVYDIIDDLSFGRHKNYTLKHALIRFGIYNEQGFNTKFSEVRF